MNCGECLASDVRIVPLQNGVCPRCGTDYRDITSAADRAASKQGADKAAQSMAKLAKERRRPNIEAAKAAALLMSTHGEPWAVYANRNNAIQVCKASDLPADRSPDFEPFIVEPAKKVTKFYILATCEGEPSPESIAAALAHSTTSEALSDSLQCTVTLTHADKAARLSLVRTAMIEALDDDAEQTTPFYCQDCDYHGVLSDFRPGDGNPAPIVCPECGRTNCFADDGEDTEPNDCPECARSFGPHYTGPCEH